QLAEDVHTSHLDFLLQHREVGREGMDAVLLNSKGFGGNNATASVLAPHVTLRMLEKRHGREALQQYRGRNEAVLERSEEYDTAVTQGRSKPIYRFDHNVLDATDLQINRTEMRLNGHPNAIDLQVENAYPDM